MLAGIILTRGARTKGMLGGEYYKVRFMWSREYIGREWIQGIVDTGNKLVEPLSRRPVIVADIGGIMDSLPRPYQRLMVEYEKQREIPYGKMKSLKELPMSIIPFATLSGEGYMLSLRCKKLWVMQGDFRKIYDNVWVAVSCRDLSPTGRYHVLLNQRYSK